MQEQNTKQARQKMRGIVKAAIVCGLAAMVLLACAYTAFIYGLLTGSSKFFVSPEPTDYIAYIGADRKKVNINELFETHLKKRYEGTYYDGEFVVDKIDVTRTLYATGYTTYAHRADIPELKFFMRTSGWEIDTDDYFVETFIAWEGAQALEDVITGIYGENVMYQVGTGLNDEAMLRRNGYADIVAHYKEDGSYPYIQIVVFTKEFDIEKASADAVELYNAVVLGRREERFCFDIAYTNSEDIERGAQYELSTIANRFIFHDSNNPFPSLFILYVEERDGHWNDVHDTLFDFFLSEFWYNNN